MLTGDTGLPHKPGRGSSVAPHVALCACVESEGAPPWAKEARRSVGRPPCLTTTKEATLHQMRSSHIVSCRPLPGKGAHRYRKRAPATGRPATSLRFASQSMCRPGCDQRPSSQRLRQPKSKRTARRRPVHKLRYRSFPKEQKSGRAFFCCCSSAPLCQWLNWPLCIQGKSSDLGTRAETSDEHLPIKLGSQRPAVILGAPPVAPKIPTSWDDVRQQLF